jgi:hypothetical protein
MEPSVSETSSISENEGYQTSSISENEGYQSMAWPGGDSKGLDRRILMLEISSGSAFPKHMLRTGPLTGLRTPVCGRGTGFGGFLNLRERSPS